MLKYFLDDITPGGTSISKYFSAKKRLSADRLHSKINVFPQQQLRKNFYFPSPDGLDIDYQVVTKTY